MRLIRQAGRQRDEAFAKCQVSMLVTAEEIRAQAASLREARLDCLLSLTRRRRTTRSREIPDMFPLCSASMVNPLRKECFFRRTVHAPDRATLPRGGHSEPACSARHTRVSAAAAKGILTLGFSPADMDHMHTLAAKRRHAHLR